MKFKTLFFLFNLIILVSFAFIFLMPLPVFGWEYALSFWGQNWAIALLFAAILIALDSYFILQWRLFSLLEREDWPGLRQRLEQELDKRGSLGIQKTRILINAYLIGQTPAKISVLRERLTAKSSRVLPKLALSLGLPLVLEGKSDAIEAFFAPLLTSRKTADDGPWIRWCVAFGRLLAQKGAEAKPLLQAGLTARKQPLLQLLSLYLLDNLKAQDADVRELVERERPILAAKLTTKEWASHIDSLKERVILVLFMEKLIGEAQQWLASGVQGAKT